MLACALYLVADSGQFTTAGVGSDPLSMHSMPVIPPADALPSGRGGITALTNGGQSGILLLASAQLAN